MSDEDGIIEVNTHRVVWHSNAIYSKLTDDHINALSGAVAGIAAGVAVCPLDVAKTRLQAQGGFFALHAQRASSISSTAANATTTALVPKKYKGLLGTISTIYGEEGVRGLYRGLTPIVIGYIPTWTIYFLLYEKTKSKISVPLSNYPALAHIASAVCAGACSTIATNPIWVVKTRLMSQHQSTSWHYRNTWDAVTTMYRTEGIRVFYTGLGPALLGLVHVAVQFPIYEKLKQILATAGSDDENKGALAKTMSLGDTSHILIASFLSKIVASSITYPHEVIRTRNQIQSLSPPGTSSAALPVSSARKYKGIIHTVRTILRDEGWRAFYAGLGTNMVRAVPSSAITLLTYELVSAHLRQARDANYR